MRNVFARERDRFAGLRIAALARRPEVQRKLPETANLDAFAAGERIAHDLKHLLSTASSMSLAGRCFCFAEMISINSDFVMAPVLNCEAPPSSPCGARTGLLTRDLLLQQVTE